MIGERPKSEKLSMQSGYKVNFYIYVRKNFGERVFNWDESPSITLNICGIKSGKIIKTRKLFALEM